MVFKNWDYPVIFRIDVNCIIIISLKPGREKELKRRRFFSVPSRRNTQGALKYSGVGYRIRTSVVNT